MLQQFLLRLSAALLLIGATQAHSDPSDSERKSLERPIRSVEVETERIQQMPQSLCVSTALETFVGDWVVYRAAGSFAYGDHLAIDGGTNGQFGVSSALDRMIQSGDFWAECQGQKPPVLRGSYNDHGCEHGIKISLIDGADPNFMLWDQNCDLFYDANVAATCRQESNNRFAVHLLLTTFHSGERCPFPDHWSHPGHAHAGGTGDEG